MTDNKTAQEALDALRCLKNGALGNIQYPDNRNYEDQLAWIERHEQVIINALTTQSDQQRVMEEMKEALEAITKDYAYQDDWDAHILTNAQKALASHAKIKGE